MRFVPENKPVARLMREMQAEQVPPRDRRRRVRRLAGLITLEDCLEELVGEIVDEYDIEDAEVERLPDGDFLVDGGMPIDELNDLLDLRPARRGLGHGRRVRCSARSSTSPSVGESVELDGWRFTADGGRGPADPPGRVSRVAMPTSRRRRVRSRAT